MADHARPTLHAMEEKKHTQPEHREEARHSESDNNVDQTLGHGNVPEVDTQYASTIKVSKLQGKWLMWMVGCTERRF